MNEFKSERNIKITNKRQFEVLVEWMERHPDIARGKGHYGTNKLLIKEKIEELASEINQFGPPVRLGEEWLRVWINFKSNLKRKMVHNKSLSLSPLEEAVSNFIKSSDSLVCTTDVAFISMNQDNESEIENENEHDNDPDQDNYNDSDNDNDIDNENDDENDNANDNDNLNDNDNDDNNNDDDHALEEGHLDLPKHLIKKNFRKRRAVINLEELRYEALQEQLGNQKQIIEKLSNIEKDIKEALYIKKRNLKLREEIVKMKRKKLEILERQSFMKSPSFPKKST